MQDFRPIFVATLAEFESPIVPRDQVDAGKGQLLVRAGYKINLANTNIGYVRKTAAQTQYLGVGVDVLSDKSDGSWTDFVTDVPTDDPNLREIKVSYSPHPASSPNPVDWVQPNLGYTQQPGPMKLKNPMPGPGPDPNPEPNPNPDFEQQVLDKLDAIIAMQTAADLKMDTLAAQSDANTEKIQTQIHDLVEDMEDSMKQILPLVTCRYTAGVPPATPSGVGGGVGSVAGAIGEFVGGLFGRSRAARAARGK